MIKRDYYVPVIVGVATVLFSIVCVGVYLSNGKSKFWISKKMKIGAFILSFSSVSLGGCVTCYEPSYGPMITVDSVENNLLVINPNKNLKVSGRIYERQSAEYSFSIVNPKTNSLIYKSEIQAVDGSFDQYEERIIFQIYPEIADGNYTLEIYDTNSNSTRTGYCVWSSDLKIARSPK